MVSKVKEQAEVTIHVGSKVFKLEAQAKEPKKEAKAKFVRYQPAADCKDIAPFSTVYVPK